MSVTSASFSSHTGPAGGRPASGLSRRRTQFRGPPPSFYASGGWGAHSAKRSAAQSAGHAANAQRSSNSASDSHPAQSTEHGYWYWDRSAHLRTHENIQGRFQERKSRAQQQQREHQLAAHESRRAQRRDTVLRFGLVSLALAATVMITDLLVNVRSAANSR